MGILTALAGSKIYLDTNIWIYALENYAPYAQALRALFQAFDNGTLSAVTSELSLAEILVKPIQRGDVEQQTLCKQMICSGEHLTVVPVSRDVLIAAAEMRSRFQVKLPDAIHGATAIQEKCSTFLTNDRQLKKITDIPIVLLSEEIGDE